MFHPFLPPIQFRVLRRFSLLSNVCFMGLHLGRYLPTQSLRKVVCNQHKCTCVEFFNSLLNELDDAMRRLNTGWLKEMEDARRKAQRDFKNVA